MFARVPRRPLILAAALIALLALTACTAGPNPSAGTPDPDGHLAGFWRGLWHGFIALFSFVVSLFNEGVQVYEVHNKGNLYNLGFVLGLMMFFGGSGGSCCGARKRG
jgi:hypothetical protein